jgi:hypothetical protein
VKSLTVGQFSLTRLAHVRQDLTNDQCLPHKSNGLSGEIFVFDALVFEFLGLAMLALCGVVIAFRRGSRRSGTHAGSDPDRAERFLNLVARASAGCLKI